jgi:sugar lactone lactonase YvrE
MLSEENMHTVWRTLARSNIFAVGLALGAACSSGTHDLRISSVPSGPTSPSPARDVVLVGNNWEGTVFTFDPNPPFPVLGTFDVVPDRVFLNKEVEESLSRKIDVGLIRRLAGEGHDQLVDDVFTSLDGRYLYASRPSYKDVVAIDLLDSTNSTPHWRTQVEGRRADHAAISPDGTKLLVSASTAKKVHEIDTASGAILRSFKSGDEPHENNYSHDGTKIFHASIGRVFLPTTSQIGDRLKGDRWFQIVDAKTFEVLERYDMRQKTREFDKDKEWKDSAVRPMAISPDDKTVFFQMSFLHGFYEFDVEQRRITRMKVLPGAEDLEKLDLSKFQLNSADHGITLNGDGTKLCVAGTMTGMAYIVNRDQFAVKTIDLRDKAYPEIAPKPYWATTSADGKNCYVSLSGLDQVVVISFDNEERIGTVRVGRHPQRIRNGRIVVSALHANGKP